MQAAMRGSSSRQERVQLVVAFTDTLLATCSTADASLADYLRAFKLEVQHDPEALSSTKVLILYHWRPGSPLEFHHYASFDKAKFDAQPGWVVLDGRNDVTACPALPLPPRSCSYSFPTMSFRR